MLSPDRMQARSFESFSSVLVGEGSSDADDTASFLALGGNHHHQVHQPLERVCHPEALKSVSVKVSAIIHDSGLEDGCDRVSIGPVGVLTANRLFEQPTASSKVEVDAIAHGEREKVGLIVVVGEALGHCSEPPRTGNIRGGVPELDFEVLNVREVGSAIQTGDERAKGTEELIPDLVDLAVGLGVDAHAEALAAVENGEDLVAELPVGLGEGGLARAELADWTLILISHCGDIINDHEVDHVADLRRQGQ